MIGTSRNIGAIFPCFATSVATIISAHSRLSLTISLTNRVSNIYNKYNALNINHLNGGG